MKLNLKSKTVGLLIFVSLLLTIGSVFICYTRYTNTMLVKYKKGASELAATESLLLNELGIEDMIKQAREIYDQACIDYGGVPNMDTMTEEEQAAYFARYDEVTSSKDYIEMLEFLQNMTDRNSALSIYFLVFDVEREAAFYLVDGSDPAVTAVCPCGYTCPIEGDGRNEIINKTYNFPTIDTDYPEFGWICTAVDPLFGADNQFLGLSQVDISLEQIRLDRIAFLIRLIVVMVAFSVILTIVAAYITNKSMVRPLKDLADATTSFVADRDSDGAGKLETIKINTGDEIEALYNSFLGMEKELNHYIDDLMQITAEKQKLGVELDLATKIQATYLPCIFPAFPDRKEFDIYAIMDPAKEVGGDFYDFFLIDEDHLGLVMADVAGKGVPAALFMMISKTIIKTYTQAGGSMDPAEILRMVNDQLCENNEAEMFVTAWLGILTISTGALITSSAGHEYPVVKRAGGEFELVMDKHGLPLASMSGVRYRNYETILNKGDMWFVYTDGVPEATSAQSELFGNDRMLDALNSAQSDDCIELIDTVRDAIDGFVKEAPQFDDITMLSFRYDGINC